MPQKQDTSIDDLAESISVLAMAVDKGFKQVNVRLDALEKGQQEINLRLTRLETAQRETNQRLDRLEGNQEALEADVKELYTMLAELRRDFQAFTKQQHARYKNLEDFALKVSVKTGIPYRPKHA